MQKYYYQGWYFHGFQEWFNSENLLYNHYTDKINKLKGKHYIIIDAEKAFDQIQNAFLKKEF